MRWPQIKMWKRSAVINGVQEKAVTLFSTNWDVAVTRRYIAADLIAHDLRLVSYTSTGSGWRRSSFSLSPVILAGSGSTEMPYVMSTPPSAAVATLGM